MKKTILAIVTCLLVFTQCKKNVEQIEINKPTGETVEVSLDASSDDDKAVIDGYSVSWVANDKLHVVGQLDGYLGYLKAQSSGSAVKFKGTIKKTTAAQNYYFYYVGDNDFALSGDDVLTFSVANQYGILSGNANSIANKFMLLKGSLYLGGTPGGELGHVTMNSMLSIARLKLKAEGTTMTSGNVTLTGSYSSVKINTKTGVYVSSSPLTSGNITLNNASGDYYMALIPGSQTGSGTSQTLKFMASGSVYASFTATIATNKFYNKDAAKVIDMCETADWINFNDSDMGVTGLPKWAKKNVGATNGATAATWYGDYYAWGELIPYATQTWTDATTVATTTWNTTTQLGGGGYVDPSKGYANESYNHGSSSFVEWNVSPCTGSIPYNTTTNVLLTSRDVARQHASWGGTWRMPTSDEWKKLKDNTYFQWTKSYREITGLKGYIVYKVKSASDRGSHAATAPSGLTYTISDPHLFLPAASYRFGTSLTYAGTFGDYWSSSHSSTSSTAMGIIFSSSSVNPQSSAYRIYGYTVRPVQ